MADLTDKVIALAIGVFLGAALLPSALTNLFGANTTGWNTDAITMWGVSGLMVVIAFVLTIIGIARRGK